MIKSSRHFFFLILAIIGVLSFSAWFAQQQIEADMREDMGASLQTVLDTSQQSIQTWVKEQKASALIWANAPMVRQFSRALLTTPHTRKALLSAAAQSGLRKLIQPVKTTKKYHGYFIISKDGVSLASSRDENIGTQNLLVTQQAFLQKILAGESAISLPQPSDVPLRNKQGRLQANLPTMFVGAPIMDDNRNVMAIFVFRIDPNEDFTAIFQRGQIGNTGETYAFNRMGQMISNSRFETELRSSGMLKSDQNSMLNILVRNPGIDLFVGQKTNVAQSEQALRLTAKHAIEGRTDRNLQGYQDYRDIPVIGTWLWDAELNFGITTEIDLDEAYATLSSVQYIVYSLTVLSVLLLSGLGIYFSISQRRILESEQRFSGIVRMADEAIISIDDTQNITLVNKAVEEIFGYTAKELLGKSLDILIPVQFHQVHRRYVDNFLASDKEMLPRDTRKQVYGVRKNGDVFPMDASISKQTVADRPIMTVVARDISARIKAGQALRNSEQQFRKIVEESPYPIAITDPVGNIEHFNRKFIELFGWTTDNARTQEEWWRIAYPDEKYRKKVRNSWESAIEKALSSGTEIEPQQWKLTCKNGDVRDVEFRMVPVSEDYNVIAMQDLTERLKAEEEKEHLQRQLMQAQKMEAIGQMTGGIAHDFNNMLAAIHGYTELAKDSALSDEYAKVPDYLDEVLDSSQRASGLVAKMLAYSRSNGGKNGLKPQALQSVIHDSLSMLKSILPSSIVFNIEIEEDLPDVLADAVQLQQVIINLCVNARDAMQGKGQIDICLCRTQMESATCHSCLADFAGSYIELSVADNGGGISPEILDRIFDPFFTTKEVGKGSGMGLSMVHGIVHDHNGHIVVQSSEGEGTIFGLFFPVCQ